MFRFFRQIRQRLLTENRFTKYLLYAIGEIVLVVIGILIALQVNTWNDERSKQRELDLLFQDTEEYLYPMATWGMNFARNYQALDSTVRVLNARSDAAFYQENPDLVRFLFNDSLSLKLPSFYWVSPGMHDLINRKTDFTEDQKSLVYDLITWKDVSQDVEDLTADFDAYLDGLRLRLIDKAPFLLEDDPENVRKSTDFVCCTGWYRYELSRVQEFTENLVKVMDLHWGSYAELYGQLMLVKEQYGPEEVAALFKQAGRKASLPLPDFAPSDLKYPVKFMANRGIAMPANSGEIPTWWQLLLNTSDKRVTVQVIYDEWIVGEWSLSPNNIARRRVPEGSVLKVIYPDAAASYHSSGRDRYLIVD